MEGFIEVNEISDFVSYIRSVSTTMFLYIYLQRSFAALCSITSVIRGLFVVIARFNRADYEYDVLVFYKVCRICDPGMYCIQKS